jgi:glycosyltransferase involved in cell wall biosynthesis
MCIRDSSKIISDIEDDIFIQIVGEGKENEVLKNLAKNLNIENRVKFLGSIIDEDTLKNIFHKSLAYVSPGHVGLGVLHSFAYGIPVVTIKHKYHAPEYDNINKNNSILYNGSINELANVLKQLVLDQDLSYRLGRNAYNHYSTKRTMTLMVQSFVKAIEYKEENK